MSSDRISKFILGYRKNIQRRRDGVSHTLFKKRRYGGRSSPSFTRFRNVETSLCSGSKYILFVIKKNSLDIRNFFKVIFDTDPAPKGIKKQDQHAIMSQAMIRGMVDEDNDQFVAYFLPVSRILMYRGE